jgi:N6-adenosine-specific RNA methylase IME4
MNDVVPIRTNGISEQKVATLIGDLRKCLAIYENPRDLVDIAAQAEFIRAAATKAKLSRDTLNEIGALLWDIVRKGGTISAQVPHRDKGRPKNLHDVSFPSAKNLGYHTAQQRQRWEICAAVSDIGVDRLKDKILASSEGILTLAPLIAAGKQVLRIQHAEDVRDDGGTVADLYALIEAGKKFGAIYADPPWPFATWSHVGVGRSYVEPYETMPHEDIYALPIEALAAEDCVLFLWIVQTQLPEAFEVVRRWGFDLTSVAFAWFKGEDEEALEVPIGCGYWTRAGFEQCWLATRGSPGRLYADVQQVIVEKRRDHSRKPISVHERIERLVAGPYLELFAREPHPGWWCWGNEIPSGETIAAE